ncbi:FemAB family XrtA/PEP-CTERM system-associated protein [Lichenicola sp.]|uniref:FemAB family XrtA/PEP-CTERM system-associated protein n=1 Tax=Lichenicola sp. TaxID=2804529 RepID=UPI003B004AB7
MRIVPLDASRMAAWDGFVAGCPEATFFHQAALPGLIARIYGHRDRSVLALQDGDVVGVLPLVELRTRLFGHALISLPFCVYGGPLAVDGEAARALLDHAAALLRQTNAATLELRGLQPLPDPWVSEGELWTVRSGLYATFRKPIVGDDAANLKAIPRKQRAVVRKGIERKLEILTTGDAAPVYRIYAESVRNLGSPVFPRRWFEALLETFPGAVDTTLVRAEGRPAAGVLTLHWRNEVLPYYGGGTPDARDCQAFDVMYWDVMCRAASRGATLFDFGRSKEGTGAYAFKKNWGFTPTPLAYRFLLRAGETVPDHNPLNPKYRLLISSWKRLPLPVANWLGPRLVRGLG